MMLTHEEWASLLAPVISALVIAAAMVGTAVLSGLTRRLGVYLDAKGHGEASRMVADASARAQAAMQNAAGQITLGMQTGRIDPLNFDKIQAQAVEQTKRIALKIPDALAILRPIEGAILEGILGKITALQAPTPVQALPQPVSTPATVQQPLEPPPLPKPEPIAPVVIRPAAPAEDFPGERKAFFDVVRAKLFDGHLVQSQVDGLERILACWNACATPSGDVRHLAYALATTYWETGRTMQPIEEVGRGAGHIYGSSGFYGRGLVQITHEDNYRRMGVQLGLDLVAHPEKALEWSVALRILFIGMARGMFTGKRLADFFNASTDDPVGARAIVNGHDRAEQIAGYHAAFLAALTQPVEG